MIKGIDYTGVNITFFCHDGVGKYLMHKRTDKCRDEYWRWDFGGGGVRHGETLEAALIREVQEEYMSNPIKSVFLGFRELFREHEGKSTHWLAFDYKVLLDPKTVSIGEPHKMAEIGWFALDALPDPIHSAIPTALEKNRIHLFT